MQKKIICILALICSVCCISGCKTTFIAGSKEKEINISDYFSELEPTIAVNSSTSINDLYFTNENGSEVQNKSEEYILYEDINCLHIISSFQIDYSVLKWDENCIARFYVFSDGNLIPFTVEDSEEYELYKDVNYVINEEMDVVIKFKTEDIPLDNGALTIMVYFNPEAEAGRGIQSYVGGVAINVNYVNQYCNAEEDNDYVEYSGEYVSIPITSVGNASVEAVGDENLYDSEYNVKKYEGDVVVVDSSDDLYIYLNDRGAQRYSNELMVGIMVDGELCKICDDKHFIKIQQNNGKQTFKYPLSALEELDSGLHSISIIKMYGDGTLRLSKRYAVIIK